MDWVGDNNHNIASEDSAMNSDASIRDDSTNNFGRMGIYVDHDTGRDYVNDHDNDNIANDE